MLSNLKEICGGHEALFQTPELLFALGELKAYVNRLRVLA
jgi:hypothetical protein